jgi:signal transduction histidine kinase
VVLVDRTHRVLMANHKAEALLQQTNEQIRGLRSGEILGCVNAHYSPKGCGYSPQCEFCPIKIKVEKTFLSRTGATFFEASMTLKDSGVRVFRMSTRYLVLDTMEAVVLGMEDVTESIEKEQLQMENTQLQTAMETAGAVCHELNQPLMVISGLLELLLLDVKKTETYYSSLEKIHQQVGRISQLIDKMMSIKTYKTKSYAGVSHILDIKGSS